MGREVKCCFSEKFKNCKYIIAHKYRKHKVTSSGSNVETFMFSKTLADYTDCIYLHCYLTCMTKLQLKRALEFIQTEITGFNITNT